MYFTHKNRGAQGVVDFRLPKECSFAAMIPSKASGAPRPVCFALCTRCDPSLSLSFVGW